MWRWWWCSFKCWKVTGLVIQARLACPNKGLRKGQICVGGQSVAQRKGERQNKDDIVWIRRQTAVSGVGTSPHSDRWIKCCLTSAAVVHSDLCNSLILLTQEALRLCFLRQASWTLSEVGNQMIKSDTKGVGVCRCSAGGHRTLKRFLGYHWRNSFIANQIFHLFGSYHFNTTQ